MTDRINFAQRWRDRRERRVPAGSEEDVRQLAVDVITERRARPFVEHHHYSGSYPAGRLAVGLFRRQELVGVAVFSVSMNNRAGPAWTGLEDPLATVELGRLVLLDDVAGNAESWFGARAFKAVQREKRVDAVLSYSDPLERVDEAGRIVKPGHVGTIYQALNGVYRGRAGKRTYYTTAGGRMVSGRSLSKIRLEERGMAYAIDQLVSWGCSRPLAHETGAEYVARLIAAGELERGSHPGNHVYVFPLTPLARLAGRALPSLPYPKADACPAPLQRELA